MNNHDLTVFATAARLGSITKAARSLATVQSNVTARIRLLEGDLGVRLFHRNHAGITLTPKGHELLPYAEQIIALGRKARETVSNTKHVEGLLRIGSLQSTASVRLPGILKDYIAKYQRVDIAIETGTAAELAERVLDRALDGAFIAGTAAQHPSLNALPAFLEEVVIVTPPGFRTLNDYLTTGSIPKVLVFKTGCFYRKTLERLLAEAGVDLLNEMEFGTLDGIIGCVSAGLGMTILPRSVIHQSVLRKKVKIHTLPPEDSRIETLFITHKSPVRSTALERFIEVILTHRPRSLDR